MLPEIRVYLGEVRSHLHLDPATEMQVMRELYSYFQEKVGELQEAGLSDKDATKVAIECCGRAKVIARQTYEAHSKGGWTEVALAFLPHLIIASLFLSHLWSHLIVAPIVFVSIVCVTLYGWWHGKPSWLYPWVGYSLLPLLIGGYIYGPTLGQAFSFLLWGRGTFPSIWPLLLICALCVFSIWVITRTTIRVVRRDWILASLMLVPLPVVGGWLLNLERAGGLFQGSMEAAHLSDMPMALALITLGVTSAAFICLRQRVLKVGAMVSIGSIALAMVGHNLWGDQGFLGFLATSLLFLLFLLSPALLEAKIGHGEQEGEAWWENSWFKYPSSNEIAQEPSPRCF
jgi:hypothetical protein